MKFNLERIEDIINLTRQLAIGLRDLSFIDNYVSFSVTETIAAGEEIRVRNSLNIVPTQYIITSQSGNGLVTKETLWDENFLYLTNNGVVPVTITVIFIK